MKGWAGAVALFAGLLVPALASAAPGPDLRVRAVGTASTQEAPGSRLIAAATVRNDGDRAAGRSRLGFYLSRDRRKSRGDFRLRPRARVRARRAHTRQRVRRTLTVPAGVPPGSYVLIACADDTGRIREQRERNNCRSATRRLRIVASGTPGPGIPTPVFSTPSIAVSGPPDGSLTFDTTPSYIGTAGSSTASIAAVAARVDGGAFSTSGVGCAGCGTAAAGWTFSPVAALADGPHSFAFVALDSTGRPSRVITRTVVVDATPPVFQSINATAGSTSVTATFSEAPACATVNPADFAAKINAGAVAVNGVSCTPGDPTVTLTLASAPMAGNTVEITLTGVISDQAGNVVPHPVAHTDGA